MNVINKRQAELIKESWLQIFENEKNIGEKFYSILFTSRPKLKHLFNNDSNLQSAKLINMLSFLVDNVYDLKKIESTIISLGQRHGEYGVEDQHYFAIGMSLIKTFKKNLESNWTLEIEAAWWKLIEIISEIMMSTRSINCKTK